MTEQRRIMETQADVTEQVTLGWIDDECCQLKKCVCGKEFMNSGVSEDTQVLTLVAYADLDCWECPNCGRKLAIQQSVRVFEVKERA